MPKNFSTLALHFLFHHLLQTFCKPITSSIYMIFHTFAFAMINYFRTHTLVVAAISIAALFTTCSESNRKEEFCINGAWELQQAVSPQGHTINYPGNGMTWLRIYDDSCYYSCQMSTAPNGTMVYPADIVNYTYYDKGHGNILYLQSNNSYPLQILNDSMMMIQESGWKHTWKLTNTIHPKRCREIVMTIKSAIESNHEEKLGYVFSNTEEELQTTNHALIYIMIFIVAVFMMFANYAYNLYRNKKRVEQELKLIEQEREALPVPVRQAMNSVAVEFHQSDFYISLRKRISNGERLKKDDWDNIEKQFQSVYPRFTSTLFSLYHMSQVEYQVCLLLKLEVLPSEIANILCKDSSSISSIRSRLYSKVFGKKGSSKDWDKFIQTL